MSTSQPAAGSTITLPPGVTVSAGRQTTQTGPQGTIVQGTLFPIQLQDGTTSQVFVPDSMLGNIPGVEQLFVQKITALQAITGATG